MLVSCVPAVPVCVIVVLARRRRYVCVVVVIACAVVVGVGFPGIYIYDIKSHFVTSCPTRARHRPVAATETWYGPPLAHQTTKTS
jgi:hypothetical protein